MTDIDNVAAREAVARLQAETGWFITDRDISDRWIEPKLTVDQVNVIVDRFAYAAVAADLLGQIRDLIHVLGTLIDAGPLAEGGER